jgi:O-antigen ligase
MQQLRSAMRTPFSPAAHPARFAALFAGSLIASLFFNGTVIEYFAVSLALLCLLTIAVLWRAYGEVLQLPRTALALLLTLFWGWLALGLLWSRVPYVSMVNFWWVGSFTFVFWLATLTPQAERCWRWSSRAVFLVGLFLAAMALYQLLILGGDPRSTFLSRNSHAAMLILVAIPASGYFLLASPGKWRIAAGIALFVLFLAVAVTGSRGVLLSLLIAVGVVTAVAYRRVPTARLIGWFGLIVAAYFLANLLLEGWLGGRLSSVFDPTYAGHDRFLIWQRAWKMVLDEPWLGIGLGSYWLFWPPYRHPADSSAGFYVHNDYLQIWIEAGLPGLLLLLAVEVAVIVMFVRMLRDSRFAPAARVEAAGLVGGLAAIAFHSFFDFDLYIQPILIVIGLMLARLHFLYVANKPAPCLALQPARRVGRRAYYTISLLLALLPLLYFTALGISARLTVQAREDAVRGRWVEASRNLSRAWQLMPTSDLTLVTHADMLRQAILALPAEARAQRATLHREALALLADAEKVNPLRPQIFFVRGLLHQHNPDLTGPDWAERAADAYEAALRRDPLAFWAREPYARLLLAQGRGRDARRVLEGGLAYAYGGTAAVGYYRLAAEVRAQQGDRAGALELARKIAAIPGPAVHSTGAVSGRATAP